MLRSSHPLLGKMPEKHELKQRSALDQIWRASGRARRAARKRKYEDRCCYWAHASYRSSQDMFSVQRTWWWIGKSRTRREWCTAVDCNRMTSRVKRHQTARTSTSLSRSSSILHLLSLHSLHAQRSARRRGAIARLRPFAPTCVSKAVWGVFSFVLLTHVSASVRRGRG